MTNPAAPALHEVRLDRTRELFEEFKASSGRDAQFQERPEQTFAAKLGISPSMWSQLKSGHRSIGHTLARQFEARFRKPHGWLDGAAPAAASVIPMPRPRGNGGEALTHDERFAVDLFLLAYRANPTLVKTRLLDLVHGELAKDHKTGNVRPIRVAKNPK
jgi:hypothetical protein